MINNNQPMNHIQNIILSPQKVPKIYPDLKHTIKDYLQKNPLSKSSTKSLGSAPLHRLLRAASRARGTAASGTKKSESAEGRIRVHRAALFPR